MGQQGKASTAINLAALELIREAFEAATNVDQQTLSDRSGVPRSTIANLVSRSADPRTVNVDTLVRLAHGLGLDVRVWADHLEAVARQQLPARVDFQSGAEVKPQAPPQGPPATGRQHSRRR